MDVVNVAANSFDKAWCGSTNFLLLGCSNIKHNCIAINCYKSVTCVTLVAYVIATTPTYIQQIVHVN